jgi:hypothetical protein
MTVVFALDFPGVENLNSFKLVSKKILADLKDALKGYTISFTKVPPKFSEETKLDISFSGDQSQPASKPAAAPDSAASSSDVELTIKGDAVLPAETPPAPTPTPAPAPRDDP